MTESLSKASKRQYGDLASRLREIICTISEDETVNQSVQRIVKLFQNAKRVFNNNLVGNFNLISFTVLTLLPCLYKELSNERVISEKKCFMEKMFPLSIIVFEIRKNEDTSSESFTNTNDLMKLNYEKGRIAYIDCNEIDMKTRPETIRVETNSDASEYTYIGVLDHKFCFYAQVPAKKSELLFTYNSLISNVSDNLKSIDKKYDLNTMATNSLRFDTQKENYIDLLSPITESYNNIYLLFEIISKANPTTISVHKNENTANGIPTIDSSTPITVLWFENQNDGKEGYIPHAIFNNTTKNLNFLVWYSDADESGFLSHAGISEGLVLNVLMTKHAKMLIYCESENRSEKYLASLAKALHGRQTNTWDTKNEKDRLKILAISNDRNKKLLAIAKINQWMFEHQELQEGTVYKNITNHFAASRPDSLNTFF